MKVILTNGTFGICTSAYYTEDKNIPKEAIELEGVDICDEVKEDGTIIKYIMPTPPYIPPTPYQDPIQKIELAIQMQDFRIDLLDYKISTGGGN